MEPILSALTMYYGLDWASMVLGFIGMYLLAHHRRMGFAFTIGACLLASFAAIIASQYGFIFANFVNIGLAGMGLIKWRESAPDPVAVSNDLR